MENHEKTFIAVLSIRDLRRMINIIKEARKDSFNGVETTGCFKFYIASNCKTKNLIHFKE